MPETINIDLSELMRGRPSMSDLRKIVGPEPILEARMMELRESAERYAQKCPFKVGDVVTPRLNASLRHTGKPHVVIEVFDEPYRSWEGETSTPNFGALYDLRVMALNDLNQIVVWSGESWHYEAWKPEMEEERREARNRMG